MSEHTTFLIISDLHMTSEGRREEIDDKVRLVAPLSRDMGDVFLATLERLLDKLGDETNWPKALIVAGDLVERGGSDEGEFEKATRFLHRVAARLKIREERVLVVPGNHDVTWDEAGADSLARERCFDRFHSATKDFTRPGFDGGKPKPHNEVFHDLLEDVDIEFALLNSPTFSGVPDPRIEEFIKPFRRILGDGVEGEPEVLLRLRKALEDANGRVDIAAIGADQREAITRPYAASRKKQRIRIAVQHHHLLPDPQLEVSPFEAVLDSGKVIDDLVNAGFDLVLTGHKHNRRFVKIEVAGPAWSRPGAVNDHTLDVYSSPSVFLTSSRGFTLLNVFGADSPCYAELLFYRTDKLGEPERRPLYREGRVTSGLYSRCAAFSPPQQEELTQLMDWLQSAFRWREGLGEEAVKELFDEGMRGAREALRALGERELTFRSHDFNERWRALLETAGRNKAGGHVRLISCDDLDFWLQSMKPGTDEYAHRQALKSFAGKKERILVLTISELRNKKTAFDLLRVVQMMTEEDQFIVRVLEKDTLEKHTELDFGVISDLAVSSFLGMGEATYARGLRLQFDREHVKEKLKEWNGLSKISFWSSDGDVNLATTLVNRYAVELS